MCQWSSGKLCVLRGDLSKLTLIINEQVCPIIMILPGHFVVSIVEQLSQISSAVARCRLVQCLVSSCASFW